MYISTKYMTFDNFPQIRVILSPRIPLTKWKYPISYKNAFLKGCAQNRGLFERKFRIVRIGRFWQFQRDWMRKICGISWACKKTICNGISGPQLTSNTNSVENFYSKFTKVFPEAVHEYFCWKLVYFGSGT